jgi:ketosteroid isomerase-like protein/predicted regulator of Ras-like GTPase activity (Roadblock/LC7/MglB family)
MKLLFTNLCHRLFLALLLLGPLGLVAQPDMSEQEKADTKLLEQRLKDFVEAYASLPTSKNKQSVLRYFHPDATSNIFVFNISGRSRVRNSNLKEFETFMDNLLRANELSINYELAEIVDIEVHGPLATLVYKVNYEIKEEGGIWVKGKETVTMAMEKMRDEWKIVHYTFMQIEDEKLKGTCLCELFISEAEDGEVVSKTTVPSGQSYSTKFDNFEFRSAGGEQIIKTGGRIYKRLRNGKLVRLTEEGEEVEIGIADSKKDAVLMIIAKDLYSDSCTRLKVN